MKRNIQTDSLQVEHFGPIRRATVDFSDLTILIGAQATGKSIFLQLFKLLRDKPHIVRTLDKYSYILDTHPENLLEAYFGQNMSAIWTDRTSICLNGRAKSKSGLLGGIPPGEVAENVFYIPAQRILSMNEGRLKNFMEFDTTTPYVLRHFSEKLRLYMQKGLGAQKQVFPIRTRLKATLKESFNETVFHNGVVIMDEQNGQKRLRMEVNRLNIPFMTWSAGQKEFMPMLLGFYGLTGPKSQVIDTLSYEYIVIEEPEMGLHPRALMAVMLEIIELMHCGYKVILSTHSTLPLEFSWLFHLLRPGHERYGIEPLLKLFRMEQSKPADRALFEGIWQKDIRTYLFSYKDEGVESRDISSLDAGDADTEVSEWGGLTGFAGKASELISEYL